MSIHWLYFRWWQDAEGRVWIWHDCVGFERIEPLETGTWRVVGSNVEPSVNCLTCGKHVSLNACDRTDPPTHWMDPASGARS